MEENRVEAAEQSTEGRTPEQKNYHAPEITVYGDLRELTMTNPSAPYTDVGAESTHIT